MLKPFFLSLPLVALVVSFPCLRTQATPNASNTTPRTQQLKVFFPKNSGQQSDFSSVEPVWRQTTSVKVAQFAVEQVVVGPTRVEKQSGFIAPIQLKGASNCGADFKLSIVSGIARVQFCRTIMSAGIGDDARILSSVTTTLKQFPSVRSVIILDQSGNCLGDMSGENRCLRR